MVVNYDCFLRTSHFSSIGRVMMMKGLLDWLWRSHSGSQRSSSYFSVEGSLRALWSWLLWVRLFLLWSELDLEVLLGRTVWLGEEMFVETFSTLWWPACCLLYTHSRGLFGMDHFWRVWLEMLALQTFRGIGLHRFAQDLSMEPESDLIVVDVIQERLILNEESMRFGQLIWRSVYWLVAYSVLEKL